MSAIFSFLIAFSLSGFCRPEQLDICSSRRTRRVFLRSGESGLLAARDISPDAAPDYSPLEGCQAEIVTCSSCVIALTFTYLNLSCQCGSGFDLFTYGPCRSDHVWVSEPLYEHASGKSFCGEHSGLGLRPGRWEYKSKTRSVRVSLFYSRPLVHAFTVDYRSEPSPVLPRNLTFYLEELSLLQNVVGFLRPILVQTNQLIPELFNWKLYHTANRQLHVGMSRDEPQANLTTGVISTPFFPSAYPRDIVVDYVLTCKRLRPSSSAAGDLPLEDDCNCRVHLVFTDFQLAAASFMEFYEGNRRVQSISGTSLRPPVVVSSTNSLTARFLASGDSSAGFKAVFSFYSENVVKKMMKPATDCGGLVGNSGGTISMVNMADSQLKLFHCIWLIQPRRNFLKSKSHLYLKVVAFFNFAGDAELQIRQGLTSESPLLETLRFPASQNSHEHVIPLHSGCYISLRAMFGPASHFALTYADFSLDGCFSLSEFLCQNFRCISKRLICDGFDHCGDNSDESVFCHPEGPFKRGKSKWNTPTPNYYFPGAKAFPTSIVSLASFACLVFFVLVLASVIYQIGSRARRQRNIQAQLRAIDDFRDSFSNEVSVEDVVIDDPPSYEPPPNYEDVVKMAVSGTARTQLNKAECDQEEVA